MSAKARGLAMVFGASLLTLLPTLAVASGEFVSSGVPSCAAAVGYTVLTFSSTFSAGQVDLADTAKPGFQWYPYRFFGGHADNQNLQLNPDGSLSLLGDTAGPNGELATASWTGTPGGFVGTAFGGGGYFEATFKFDPQDVVRNDFKGWPSWWSMALEHMVSLGAQQWAGQPQGYDHFIEADFFEYDLRDYVDAGQLNYFGAAMHDWFGPSGEAYNEVALPSRLFARAVPADTVFTQFHRYGFLWVPATANRDGYAEVYFDGRKVGRRIAWTPYANQAPPPKSPWLYSIIDRSHLVLLLGTGPDETMTVRSVNVWQASDVQNMKR